MSQDKLSKRESIKNLLIAATGVGLSMAAAQNVTAQPTATAGPPAISTVSPGPTTVPKGTISRPTDQPRGALKVAPTSKPKNDKSN